MAGRARALLDPSKLSSPLSIAASRTALLLMDFQNLTISRISENDKQVVKVAQQMREWALDTGIPVLHCLIDTKSGAAPDASSRMSERWENYKEKLIAMPQLGDEPDGLAKNGSDAKELTFTRTPGLVSALFSNGIEQYLGQNHISSLILCGISTSGCVLSTCRNGTDAGYVVTVVEDACCDPAPGLQDAIMSHVIPATAHVVKAEEFKSAFRNAPEVKID